MAMANHNPHILRDEGVLSLDMPISREQPVALKLKIPNSNSELKVDLSLQQPVEAKGFEVGWTSTREDRKGRSPLYIDLHDEKLKRHKELGNLDMAAVEQHIQLPQEVVSELEGGVNAILENVSQCMAHENALRCKKVNFEPLEKFKICLSSGKPYKLWYAIEFTEFEFDKNCLLYSDGISDSGTHKYLLHTNLTHWGETYRSQEFFKLSANDFVKLVQNDIVKVKGKVQIPDRWTFYGFQKRKHGVRALLSFHFDEKEEEHGVLLTLVPTIPATPSIKISNEELTLKDKHKPAFPLQAREYDLNLDDIQFHLLKDDQPSHNEGKWTISSAKRDLVFVESLPSEITLGIRLAMYVNHYYLLENSPEVDPQDIIPPQNDPQDITQPQIVPKDITQPQIDSQDIMQHKVVTTKNSLQLFGMKSPIRSRLFHLLMMNLSTDLLAFQKDIFGVAVAHYLFYILYQILLRGNRSKFWFEIKSNMDSNSTVSFCFPNYKKITKFIENILDNPATSFQILATKRQIVNFPLQEHAVLTDSKALNGKEVIILKNDIALDKECFEKDELICHLDDAGEWSRTVHIRQKLYQSWIIKVKLVDLGTNKDTPFYIGVHDTKVTNSEPAEHFESGILKSAKYKKDMKTQDQRGISKGTTIEISWEQSKTQGQILIKRLYTFEAQPVFDVLADDVQEESRTS